MQVFTTSSSGYIENVSHCVVCLFVFVVQKFLINFNHSFKLRISCKKIQFQLNIQSRNRSKKSSLTSLGIKRKRLWLWSGQRVFKEACRCIHSSWSQKFSWWNLETLVHALNKAITSTAFYNCTVNSIPDFFLLLKIHVNRSTIKSKRTFLIPFT